MRTIAGTDGEAMTFIQTPDGHWRHRSIMKNLAIQRGQCKSHMHVTTHDVDVEQSLAYSWLRKHARKHDFDQFLSQRANYWLMDYNDDGICVRIHARLSIIFQSLSPHFGFVVLRTIMSWWMVSSTFDKKNATTACAFGCGADHDDNLNHYLACDVVSKAVFYFPCLIGIAFVTGLLPWLILLTCDYSKEGSWISSVLATDAIFNAYNAMKHRRAQGEHHNGDPPRVLYSIFHAQAKELSNRDLKVRRYLQDGMDGSIPYPSKIGT